MALAVAFVAFRSPRLVREGLWSGICLGVFGASLASLAIGIAQESAFLVALGSPFGGAGQVWFSILIGIALSRIGLAHAAVCAPSGFALAFLAQATVDASGLLPGYGLGILLYFLCTATSYLLIRGPVRRQLAVIRESHSPVVLDATNPHSFLPLGSKAFIAIGLFNAALGYVFGSGVGAGDALLAMLSSIPVLLLFFAMAVMRRSVSPDTVYLLSTALVIAGLLLVPFRFLAPGFPAAQAAPLLLQSGELLLFAHLPAGGLLGRPQPHRVALGVGRRVRRRPLRHSLRRACRREPTSSRRARPTGRSGRCCSWRPWCSRSPCSTLLP